jgi:simple sugar transport system ATP-binding protein
MPPSPPDTDPSGVPAVELRGISKSFFGVPANDGIDFDLARGEVHALLGENGAGKSTLCSVLAGLYRPDAGEIWVDGISRDFRSPHDALAAGVGMIYQHFRLVRNFTVAENIVLGHPDAGLRLRRRVLEQKVNDLVDHYGLSVHPAARVWQLSVGEQQRVEILKMLYRNVRVLILDEPTAVLTPQEADLLFASVRAVAAEGTAVVLVSHKLDEVLEASDRITVLRQGTLVGTIPTATADASTLARMMVGHSLAEPRHRASAQPGDAVLTVRGLRIRSDRGYEAVRGVELSVHEGQIVGIAGVAGNGQRELAEAIAGLRPATSGEVTLAGVGATGASPLERIRLGLGFVPEDRLGMGLAAGLSLEDNLVLKSYRSPPYCRGPFLVAGAISRRARELIATFEIRGARAGFPVRLLSGGNLQRAILAREIGGGPRLLVAASPTRGLDVGAAQAIHRLLLEQRDGGMAILLISEDLDEIHALSDEVLVIHRGEFVGRLSAAEFDAARVGLLMAGHAAPTPFS